MDQKVTVFQKSREGRGSCSLPACDVPRIAPDSVIPAHLLRQAPVGLPEISEPELVRHYVNLSTKNHHVDKDLYPLGSCTMKYNPKASEDIASYEGFTEIHPLLPGDMVQGALAVFQGLCARLRAWTRSRWCRPRAPMGNSPGC